jgi:hypothetical protein
MEIKEIDSETNLKNILKNLNYFPNDLCKLIAFYAKEGINSATKERINSAIDLKNLLKTLNYFPNDICKIIALYARSFSDRVL